MRQLECDFSLRVYCEFDLACMERFAVDNAEAVFGLIMKENGILKNILPKEP